MNSTRIAFTCLVLLAVAGCQPEPVAPAGPAPAAAPTEVAVANAEPSEGTSTFDQRSLAGTFTGLASGVESVLSLTADGSFALSETPAGSTDARMIDGTWTVEAEDRHVRLDPNSKSEPDRLFAITGNDRISALGSDGESVPGGELARQ